MNLRTWLVLILLLLLPASAFAATPPITETHWSLGIKGGWFYPAIDNWETYYGNDRTWNYAASLAYKLRRDVELGVEGGFSKDRGQGSGAISGSAAGKVEYELFPLQVFVLLRASFSEKQWFVPYVGGGWTRMFYREKIEAQGTARGTADGYHGRLGLQILLDDADSIAARNLVTDFGIYHTYFFIEAQSSSAKTDDLSGRSVDLGGTSYFIGLLFEF